MGVMKVTDSDGNVGYLETSIDLSATTIGSPARLVQNRELLAGGAVLSGGNPLPITITNWNSSSPVAGPGTSTQYAVPMFASAGGNALANSAFLLSAAGILTDLVLAGSIQPTIPTAVSIGAATNNLATAGVMVVSINATASFNLSGAIAGAVQATTTPGYAALDGRILVIRNVATSASFTITIRNLDSNSLTQNQFSIPGNNLVLSQGASVTLMYDGNLPGWRVIAANYTGCDTIYSRNQTYSRALAYTLAAGASLAANQTDYALSNVPYWQLSSTVAITVFNMANTAPGSLRLVENIGTFPITLAHEAGPTTGTAVNNFKFQDNADHVLLPNTRLMFVYDTTNSRWRPLGVTRGSIGNFTVANLPALASMGSAKGHTAVATNGRKSGEGAASGTGVPVWWDGANWKTFFDNTTVAA